MKHAIKYLLALCFFLHLNLDYAFCAENELKSELPADDLEWVNDYLDDCD